MIDLFIAKYQFRFILSNRLRSFDSKPDKNLLPISIQHHETIYKYLLFSFNFSTWSITNPMQRKIPCIPGSICIHPFNQYNQRSIPFPK